MKCSKHKIFNTSVHISTIYKKIDEIIKKHKNCKRQFGYESSLLKTEKGIRGYLFSHLSDAIHSYVVFIFKTPLKGRNSKNIFDVPVSNAPSRLRIF